MSAVLRARMGSLLMSPAAQKIDFYLDRFHVDGWGFTYVALALLSQPVRGAGFRIRTGGVAPGADATYQPANNTFSFPNAGYGQTAFQRMSIIHEATHAMRDSQGRRIQTSLGPRTTTAVSDEAAAFIAGALFHIFDTASTTAPSWATPGSIFETAHNLAVAGSGQFGYAFSPQDAKTMRDAVLAHPIYRSLRRNPRTSYSNNGVRL